MHNTAATDGRQAAQPVLTLLSMWRWWEVCEDCSTGVHAMRAAAGLLQWIWRSYSYYESYHMTPVGRQHTSVAQPV